MTQNYNLPYTGEEVQNILENSENVLHSQPVNVLTLGVDNTGKNSISDIINGWAAVNPGAALYFPAGLYLITKTLVLSGPVYGVHASKGAGETIFINGIWGLADWYSQTNKSDYDQRLNADFFDNHIKNLATREEIIQYATENTYDHFMIVNIGAWNSFKGFTIWCSNKAYNGTTDIDSGIGAILDIGTGTTNFDDITIEKLGNADGICINHSVSAAAYFNNIYIFSLKGLKYSVGLNICQGTDIRMTNIRSNAWRGLSICDMAYGSNIHTWAGKNNNDTDLSFFIDKEEIDIANWWNTSAGIYAPQGIYCMFDNIYLDTCKNLIFTEGPSIININNLMSWDDGTIYNIYAKKDINISSDLINGSLIKFGDNVSSLSTSKISIRGGMVYPHKCQREFFKPILDCDINSISDLTVILPSTDDSDPYFWTDKYKYILPLPVYGYNNKYKVDSRQYTDSNVFEIGRVKYGNGVQELIITNAVNDKTRIRVATGNASTAPTITIQKSSTDNAEYYYRVQGTTDKTIIIFSTSDVVWCETTEKFVNYDYAVHYVASKFNRYHYNTDTLDNGILQELN